MPLACDVPPLPPRCDESWIQTFSGRQFWPLNPRPEDVVIEDIAHALAMKCRYTGHSREFYSVAQHSVLASWHCDDAPLWALLHDAAEAYLPDVARPVKRRLAGFAEIEHRVMEAIATRFGLQWPEPPSVKRVDLQLLATERRDLMATPPIPWTSTEQIEPLEDHIFGWSPEDAKDSFLRRFYLLTGER